MDSNKITPKPQLVYIKKGIRYLVRSMLGIIALYFTSFAVAFIVLNFPAVQNRLVPYINEQVSKALKTKVTVGRIELDLFDKVILKDVFIEDRKHQPMISVKNLKISVISTPTLALFTAPERFKRFYAQSVQLEDVYLNLYIDPDFDQLNIEKVFASEDTTKSTSEPPKLAFNFPSIKIKHMRFNFTDSAAKKLEQLEPTKGRFNFQNLRFKNLNLDAGLKIDDEKNVFLTCYELKAYETNSDLELKHFSMQFQSITEQKGKDSSNFVRFYDTRFSMGKTNLHFDLFMKGQTIDKLFRSGENRKLDLNVKNSNIDFATINCFSPASIPLAGVVKMDGHIHGDYKKLRSKNLFIGFGDSAKVYADLKINDYTKPEIMYMQLKCERTFATVKDIEGLIPSVKMPKEVKNIGSAYIEGKFTGFLKDFVADASFSTPLGKVVSDINLKIGDTGDQFNYRGNIKTQNLNLDRLLDIKVSDRLNFNATVQGTSTDFASAIGKYRFNVGPSRFLGFEIDSVGGEIILDKKMITGNVSLDDSEGKFNGNLEANFRKILPEYYFMGEVSDFDIKHYQLTKLPVRLSSRIEIKSQGDTPDNLNGNAKFHKLYFSDYERKKDLEIRDLSIATADNSMHRKDITIDGSAFYLRSMGDWRYNQIINIAQNLTGEILNFIKEDSLAQNKLYSEKKIENATVSVQFIARDIDPIFNFFEIPIRLASKTELAADFDFSHIEFSSINLKSDSLKIDFLSGKNLDLQFKLKTPSIKDSFQVATYLNADALTISNSVTFENVKLQSSLVGREIQYILITGRDTTSNYIHLEGGGRIAGASFETEIYPKLSKIVLKDSVWRIEEKEQIKNRIYVKDKTLLVENLKIHSNDHILEIDGDIRPGISDVLKAKMLNMDLAIINRLVKIPFDLSGKIGMEIEIYRLFEDPIIKMDGKIDSIFVNKLSMGNLVVATDWSDEKNQLRTKLSLVRLRDSIINLKGFYDLNSENSPLNFVLNTEHFPVELFKDYLSEAVYDLSGSVDLENVSVAGSFKNLDIKGKALLEAKLGLIFLRQKFYVNDALEISKNKFILKKVRIFNVDNEKNKIIPFQFADINGELSHTNFDKIKFWLEIQNMKKFNIMKTTKHDNSTFYGTAIAENGKLMIKGSFDEIKISSERLTPARGTIINIPVATYEKRNRLDYVKFISHDTIDLPEIKEKELAIEIDMEIEMNPEAEVNIIFDERVGDKIRAKGSGTIALNMNKDSELNMMGKYEITEGNYLFTYINVINKSFEIQPGSYLRWTGNPFNALIDLNAYYQVANANLKAWDTTVSSARVNVNMKMTGVLQKPDIRFGLEVPGIAQSQSYGVATTLRQIETDPQELNRQVFSLIALSSVAPIGRFFGQDAAQSGVASNITEFFTNQLNNLISQSVNQNIGASVSLNKDQLLVSLKANLFNDRVTIERNGAISNGANRDISLGNISVQLRLLPGTKNEMSTTGLLAAEVFNRETNISSTINSTTRGVGVFYRKEFEIIPPDKKISKKIVQKNEKKIRKIKKNRINNN